MDKIKITKRQKKIFMVVGIVGGAFLIFILFIHLPLNRQMVRLKDEVYLIESEISQIRKAGGEDKSLEEAISFLKTRLETLDNKFTEKDEVILRELSGLATRLGIEVASIRPQKKRAIQDINGVPIKISGCFVQEMSVSMSLKTSYKTLGQFFKNLKDEYFPIFARVEGVSMSRTSDKAAQGKLDVELNLNTYLISPETK